MQDTDSFRLGDLSSEIIIQILHHCDCVAILRFAATCKGYHELVEESISLQLHIELEANGLELVKGTCKQDATYSVILEDLKRFQEAWLKLDFREPILRSLGGARGPLWDLREGFYIKGFSRTEGRFADTIQLIPLDAETPDPPPLMFNFEFKEFTTDPGQALVVLMSGDLDRQAPFDSV
ncbi:unnamed protein product [Rhizoctonia solani]|uniref:F-box domain-containing protein n=1 Tax=Rhizoctonia solani TaxID=456999 RepID=A0A8H3DAG0_9AGAM|nr:unnamed protein product [Rhizoctonia solani]